MVQGRARSIKISYHKYMYLFYIVTAFVSIMLIVVVTEKCRNVDVFKVKLQITIPEGK